MRLELERSELERSELQWNEQERQALDRAAVLVVGVGGLGSPLAYHLAAAGVGRIGLCDLDRVDRSNLQRQVAHFTADVGRPKVESAAAKIRALNPTVAVTLHEQPITPENALELVAGYDLIFDATDNFATRYLTGDAAVVAGKPYVHGSIYQFDGQVTVIAPGGPCYRCLYPNPPGPGVMAGPADKGVIGVLPGVVGSLMAMEGLKLLTGRGEPLIGRLLVYNSLFMEFAEVRVKRNPDCPLCGDHPTIQHLADVDYRRIAGGEAR